MKKTSLNSEHYMIAEQKITEKKYWLDKLAGELIRSEFPYSFNKKSKSTEFEVKSFQLHGHVCQRLLKLSNRSDLRLHIIFTTAIFCMLFKYTGNRDIIVGVPVTREQISGNLINTVLTLRIFFHNQSIKDLLLLVSKEIFEASQHQNYPLRVLMDHLGIGNEIENDFSLFDVGVLLKNIHKRDDIRQLPINLLFLFSKNQDGISVEVEYNPFTYQLKMIQQIMKQFHIFLEIALNNLDMPLDEICILSQEDQKFLLEELNKNEIYDSKANRVDGLFEQQVERVKNHSALMNSNENSITYIQLNKKANYWVNVLKLKGVQDDTVVAIIADRSENMIGGILGILKAGGAYLPIASGNPQSRIQFLLEDSGVKYLLIQDHFYNENKDFLQFFKGEVLVLDKADIDHELSYHSNIEISKSPHHLAYMIYTSGTSGRPKGVMVQHSALVNFLFAIYHIFDGDFDQRDNCMNLCNISFDVSVCEIFLPLAFGATMSILPNDCLFDSNKLSMAINKRSITYAYIPPGLLKDVSQYLKNNGQPVTLNKLLVGVEPINDYVLEDYRQLNHTMKIVNGYGPTESTICATFYKFDNHICKGENVPIGEPLSNLKILILSSCLELLPFGVPGELCISGIGLSRGYLNHPELTDEKFIFHRYFQGRCIYRTGDMARWRDENIIEFLGRVDSQVKVRGNRIEPGEIENQLMKHPKIKQAVVIDRVSQQMEKYLCAYVIIHKGDDDNKDIKAMKFQNSLSSQLVDFLSQELPTYMIPQYFIEIDHIPLTPHGKLDKKALKEPIELSASEFIAPGSDVEETIATIWKEILDLDKVSTNANFFEIGGNSLSIVKLKNSLETELDQKIPDVKLIEYPTISSFSQYLNQEMSGGDLSDSKDTNGIENIEDSYNYLNQRRQLLEGDMT